MILTGSKIAEEVRQKRIHITPFDESRINPNSYNFRLGKLIKVYKDNLLDPKQVNETEDIIIPEEGIIISPDKLYLGHTMEIMGSNEYVPIIRGRSSIGRIGVFINITADLIDIGSINQWTLQIHAVQPVRLYAGMHIGQVTFWETEGEITLYDGKYKNSRGPMESQIYKDFLK
jgi:dCTP deaminase